MYTQQERFWEPTDYVEQDIISRFGCVPERLDNIC